MRRPPSPLHLGQPPPPLRFFPPRRLCAADCCAHVAASLLLCFIVIQKWHYVTAWYVFGFLGAPPALFEVGAILSVVVLKQRKW